MISLTAATLLCEFLGIPRVVGNSGTFTFWTPSCRAFRCFRVGGGEGKFCDIDASNARISNRKLAICPMKSLHYGFVWASAIARAIAGAIV